MSSSRCQVRFTPKRRTFFSSILTDRVVHLEMEPNEPQICLNTDSTAGPLMRLCTSWRSLSHWTFELHKLSATMILCIIQKQIYLFCQNFGYSSIKDTSITVAFLQPINGCWKGWWWDQFTSNTHSMNETVEIVNLVPCCHEGWSVSDAWLDEWTPTSPAEALNPFNELRRSSSS